MAGNTGKMTAEALAARGPRMFLVMAVNPGTLAPIGAVVYREGYPCLKTGQRYYTYSKSYTLGYLLRVGKLMLASLGVRS